MYALLGDFNGKIYVDEHSSKEFIYARVNVLRNIYDLPHMEVIIVKNKGVVPNIYGFPVNVFDGEVTSRWRFTPEF